MGPLSGIKIIEFAGIGPAPMAAMQLADLGATVLRIDRREASDLGVPRPHKYNLLLRNRSSIALDLKNPDSVELVLELIESADALIEGFRPGVMERFGLGPDICLQRNPALAYGRMTGWGQSGPLAGAAGHDINYIALTGVLNAVGREGHPPTPPLALAGDFGGGAMFLVMGLLAAILHAKSSGQGQVVDAAIIDGAASLATAFYGLHAAGLWSSERGTNILDSGAPYYDSYECLDGKWISIGPIENRFYRKLLEKLELDEKLLPLPSEKKNWAALKKVLTHTFKTRTQSAWCDLLEGTDVCFAPVLSFDEAAQHPHLQHRGTLIDIDGVTQPAPAPRFSVTPQSRPTPPSPVNDPGILDLWLTPDDARRFAHLITTCEAQRT